ncbi:MAG: hypothetical protein ACI89L_002310 [Phycisphaerales bacterium]|jgi:hypothetical protein
MKRLALWLSATAALALAASPLAAQTDTAFTYQGNLADNGSPADGTYDLNFELWDALSGGAMVGVPVSIVTVPIAEGLFTVELDFGAAAFDNSQRWLQITVQGLILSPRQPITRTPYSIQTRGIFVNDDLRVGIGITDPLFYKFQVQSDDTHAIRGDATSPSKVGVWGHGTVAFSYGVVGSCASSEGYDFYANGAGTNYGAASSRRWKNNIVNIDDPLGKLAQLRGVYYDWDQEHGGMHDVGMIAEEVGKVLPEIVQYEANGYDASGMDYSKLTPLLVEAVNALRAENEAQICALRRENDSLRDRLEALEAVSRPNTRSND